MRLVKRLLILIALMAPLFAHAANPNSTLIGKWSGVDSEGIKGGFSFNADGSAEMIAGSDVYNETSEYKLMWETETDSKPMRIILRMMNKSDNSTISKFYMVFEIVNKDKIRLGIVEDPKKNPTSIDALSESDRITMKRK